MNQNCKVEHVNFENIKTTYNHALVYVISFNEFDDVNFTKCNLTNMFRLAGSGNQNAFSDTFKNIHVLDSSVGTLGYTAFQWPDMNYKNIYFTNTNITQTLFRHSYIGSAADFNTRCDGLYFENCNVSDDIGLFTQKPYTENSIFDSKSYSYTNIHLVNVATNMPIFTNNMDFKLTNSSFSNINNGNNPLIQGYNLTVLYNVSLDNVNITGIVSDNNLSNTFNMINIADSNFTSDIIFILHDNNQLYDSGFDNIKGHIIVNGSNVKFRNTVWNNCNNPDLNGSCVELVDGNYISFKDCNFTNNIACNGAVYLASGSTRPEFNDCNFTNNTQYALYISYPEGNFTVVTFTNLTLSTLNGTYEDNNYFNGIYGNITQAFGIVFVVNDTSTWTYSTTHDCKTWQTAGSFTQAYGMAGRDCIFVFVRNGDIFNYTGTSYEGVLMPTLDSGWVLQGNNTTFINIRLHIDKEKGNLKASNITYSSISSGPALVIDEENCVFEDCVFMSNGGDNVAHGNVEINANNTNITRCIIRDNVAGSSDGAWGGALYINASNININDCVFESNKAYTTGAHIYLEEDNEGILINNTRFIGGIADAGGDGNSVVLQGTNIVVNNCTFERNNVKSKGVLSVVGVIRFLTISNCVFDSNVIVGDNGFGGALSLEFSNPLSVNNVIDGNNFTNNYVTGSRGCGAALYVNTVGITVSNSNFVNNSASSNGGATYINSADFRLVNCNFTSNQATSNGGGLYLTHNANNTYIEDCNFTSNIASNYAGGIFSESLLSIIGSNFRGNNATVHGGAILLYSGNCNVEKCTFENNYAGNQGAGIRASSKVIVSVKSCIFINNTAESSAGAMLFENGKIDDCNFTGNEAHSTDVGGGALYIRNGDVEIINSNFKLNTALHQGGAIQEHNILKLNITNCTFTNNNATEPGGAVSLKSSCIIINDSTFNNNTAGLGGGAIYLWHASYSFVTITTSHFNGNNATSGDGGAICIAADNVAVTGCDFTSNNATQFGGAIYVQGNNATVTGCEFTGNTAVNGSAIYVNNETAENFTVKDSTFKDNVASGNGTIYIKDVNGLSFAANTFTNNKPNGTEDDYYLLNPDDPSYKSKVVYVNSTGGGTGLTKNSPTSWETAFNKIIEFPAEIILASDITIKNMTFTNKNVTIVGNGHAIRRNTSSSESKYMFNRPRHNKKKD